MTSESAEAPRQSRLDRWLEPPWRALLTWIVLAGVTNIAWYGGVGTLIGRFEMSVYDRFFSGYPYVFYRLFQISSDYPFFVWYQPIVLRLSPLRWVIWIGASVVWAAVFLHWEQWSSPWLEPLSYWAWPILSGVLLIGCRTRPWMSVPAGALSLLAAYWLFNHGPGLFHLRVLYWWYLEAAALPYGIVMLYGTRRLPPKVAAQYAR